MLRRIFNKHTYALSKIFVAANCTFTGRYWYGANMQRNTIIQMITEPILQHVWLGKERLRQRKRKTEVKAAALVYFAVDPDIAAIFFDKLLAKN